MSDLRLDLDRYLRIPRLADLEVSADGAWVAFSAARPSGDGKKFARDLYRARTAPGAPPERLTRGDDASHHPRFLADGSLLFLSNRKDPDRPKEAEAADGDPAAQIWHLPAQGDARCLTRKDGGVSGFRVAPKAGVLLYAAELNPGSADDDTDRASEKERRKLGATGRLFEALPLRHWDRFFGPRYCHLFFAASLDQASTAVDLTPQATIEHDELGFDLSADGAWAVAGERQRDPRGQFAENLRLFDLQTGGSRLLTSGRDVWAQPRFAPDGRSVVAVFHQALDGRTGRQWLARVPLDGGKPEPLTADLDLWPESPCFCADGSSLFFLADQRGHHPLFELVLASGKVRRLTARGAYGDLAPSPCREAVFAIGSRLDRAPEVVAVEPGREDQTPRQLTSLAGEAAGGVPLREPEALIARGAGGREVHCWLVLPDRQPPPGGFPLLVWVHGGPLGAWADAWHWRWNPQLFAARGYAVLLPNPRISTGYGQDWIEQGFARWGGEPYDDVMAACEQAARDPRIDGERMAAMGGSYGGYMVNWMAGQSRRFRCIVSHAGLWQLLGFHGTTDWGMEWEREFGDPYRKPEGYEQWSPHRRAAEIRTPVLFVHGEKDYRVPVGEAFQGFTALQRLGVPSRLLYFPDENHWILRPHNIRQWHETIWEWLARWL